MARFSVRFLRDRCKACELCISVCPKQILEIETDLYNKKGYHPARVQPGKEDECIGCTSCATICPDSVISVFDTTKE